MFSFERAIADAKSFNLNEGLKPPKLRIADISFTLDNFYWAFLPGALPYKCAFRIDVDAASAIFQKSNNMPTTLEYEYHSATDIWKGEIKNIFVLRKDDDGIYLNTLVLSDPRYLWEGRIVVGRFNWRYQLNRFMIASASGSGKAVANDPSAIPGQDEAINYGDGSDGARVFKDRFIIPKAGILPPTLYNGETKWTALQLAQVIASSLLGDLWGGFIESHVAGGNGNIGSSSVANWSGADVTPENILFDGVPVPVALTYLLHISRSQMAFFPDGKIYIYDMSDDDIAFYFDQAGLQGTSNSPFAKWKQLIDVDDTLIHRKFAERERPSMYYVLFDREIETPFVYEHGAHFSQFVSTRNDTSVLDTSPIPVGKKAEAIRKGIKARKKTESSAGYGKKKKNQAVITPSSTKKATDFPTLGIKQIYKNMFTQGALVNVGITPFNFTQDGVTYYKGQYVPIEVLLKEVGLTTEFLLKHWYRDVWKYWFYYNLATGIFEKWLNEGRVNDWTEAPTIDFIAQYNREANNLANEISRSFLQTFKIKENYREKIFAWSAKRAGVADRVTGYRVWSPVWVNYTEMPVIYAMMGKDKPDKPKMINIDIAHQPIGTILNRAPTPFKIEVEDEALGVFHLSMVADFHNVYYGFEIGDFGADIPPTTPEYDFLNWFAVPKNPTIKVITLLTVKPITPNIPVGNIHEPPNSLFYVVPVKPYNPGSAPPMEIYCRREVARFVWKSSYTDPDQILHNPPINKEILDLFAQSEVNIKEFELQDWHIGRIKLLGIHPVRPFGNAAITYYFTSTVPYTLIDMTKPPEAPDLYTVLPKKHRQFLWGELGAWYNNQ